MSLITEPTLVRKAINAAPERPPCKAVLMADPAHFRVESVINPWMADAAGKLNVVDEPRARAQWNALKVAYETLGLKVEVIQGKPGLPDFCFCANQAVTFRDAAGNPAAILSYMRSETRAPEVPIFEAWYRDHGYALHRLPPDVKPFEGTGDAIWHHGRRVIWGGVGPRTGKEAWEHVARITGAPVIPLTLVDSRYYHLDTALAVMNRSTALYIPAAFDEASRERLKQGFDDLIPLSDADAANFACNAHCPDDRNVLLQEGSQATVNALMKRGFGVIELDTSEFMKSGGSVFCLKQELA